jgi:CheY-like chemotaxis protein
LILFFDDEAMYVEPYVDALKEAGYSVVLATQVADALAYFQQHLTEIEIAIIDILSPLGGPVPSGFDVERVQDGLRTGEELIRTMNRIPGGECVRKLVLSNVDSNQDRVGKLAGVAAVVLKRDVLPSDLPVAVRKALAVSTT